MPVPPVSILSASNPVCSFSILYDYKSQIKTLRNNSIPFPCTQCNHNYLPLQLEPLIPQSLPSETDIRRSCRFVKGDIELLAGLIGVTYPELVDIQQNYRIKEVCALRLIEKWMQRNPEKSKDDLYQLLLDANQHNAARRLKKCFLY